MYQDLIHFTMSLNTGRIPDVWKKASVTPIFKNKGSNTDLDNYRPHIPKCFEKIVDMPFRQYLLAHAFFTQSQSSFHLKITASCYGLIFR